MKRILYIEDNPNDQRFVKKVLGTHGYELAIAGDGETGIRLAGTYHPDLILVDIQMPDLDGLGTAKRLRAVEGCQTIPIVALTAYAEKYQKATYLEAGFSDYQQKQAGIKPLLEIVRQHVG
jgi:two-component system cell cycle response regulator DivK